MLKNKTIYVLCCGIALMFLTASCKTSEGDAVELRKSIERLLPIGSSYDSVIRFLEQYDIDYSKMQATEGYDPRGNYGIQHVLIGTSTRSLFGIEQSRVKVVFYFNENRQLSGSVVTPSKS